jgi:hypothetical protein
MNHDLNVARVFGADGSVFASDFSEQLLVAIPARLCDSPFGLGARPASIVLLPKKVICYARHLFVGFHHPDNLLEFRAVRREPALKIWVAGLECADPDPKSNDQ